MYKFASARSAQRLFQLILFEISRSFHGLIDCCTPNPFETGAWELVLKCNGWRADGPRGGWPVMGEASASNVTSITTADTDTQYYLAFWLGLCLFGGPSTAPALPPRTEGR